MTPIGQDTETLTGILGEPCPGCGWRRGAHRPPIKVGNLDVAPCPYYSPEPEPEAAP